MSTHFDPSGQDAQQMSLQSLMGLGGIMATSYPGGFVTGVAPLGGIPGMQLQGVPTDDQQLDDDDSDSDSRQGRGRGHGGRAK